MFNLKLNGKLCVCCGICMDVCRPAAIDMRRNHMPKTIEGARLVFRRLASRDNPERKPEAMMTFPYLSRPAACDGCLDCVNQCPVSALTLTSSGHEGTGNKQFTNPQVGRDSPGLHRVTLPSAT